MKQKRKGRAVVRGGVRALSLSTTIPPAQDPHLAFPLGQKSPHSLSSPSCPAFPRPTVNSAFHRLLQSPVLLCPLADTMSLPLGRQPYQLFSLRPPYLILLSYSPLLSSSCCPRDWFVPRLVAVLFFFALSPCPTADSVLTRAPERASRPAPHAQTPISRLASLTARHDLRVFHPSVRLIGPPARTQPQHGLPHPCVPDQRG
jgi:hypothetical protein